MRDGSGPSASVALGSITTWVAGCCPEHEALLTQWYRSGHRLATRYMTRIRRHCLSSCAQDD
jgi:hypothetical protein